MDPDLLSAPWDVARPPPVCPSRGLGAKARPRRSVGAAFHGRLMRPPQDEPRRTVALVGPDAAVAYQPRHSCLYGLT